MAEAEMSQQHDKFKRGPKGASLTLYGRVCVARSKQDGFDAVQVVSDLPVYVGSLSVGFDVEGLREREITYVLTVVRGIVDCDSGSVDGTDIERAILQLKDDGKEVLVDEALEDAIEFVDEAVVKGRGVLVHCEKGVSRSVSVVIAYLIRKRHMAFAESLDMIRKIRPQACPNLQFALELKKLKMS